MRDQQLIKFLVTALAIFISGMLLPGVDVANVWVAMILAAILFRIFHKILNSTKLLFLPFLSEKSV